LIHPLSDVKSIKIGQDTFIWQFSVILESAQIGNNCNINCHVFIENNVIIGDNVTVKSGVYIWDGITIKDNVFIGPNVTFTNDKHPRSKRFPTEFQKTILHNNASIGAGAIILGGVQIGSYAMVGAGSLVTKNIPDRALVYGSPASIKGWLNDDGTKMIQKDKYFVDNNGNIWEEKNQQLIKA
jgi:UDP-2-acetamido-3-amino-2,3-dideoxy-glucuronate N-acetyltransferase